MKAIIYESFGESNVLKVAQVDEPILKENEVLVKVGYTSVNPVDWKIRQGYLSQMLPHRFPIIPGWDAAGEVVAIGRKVSRFKVGDHIYAYTRKEEVHEGSYAEFITLEESYLAHAPSSIGLEAAAAIPLVGLTAWQALVDAAKITAKDTVFIAGGAGGVGSLAVQIAKVKGAKVITSASKANHSYLESLGADTVFDYRNQDVVAEVKKIAPQGVDVVLDAVGGETLEQVWELIKKGGRLVSIVDTPSEELAKAKGVTAQFVFVAPNGSQLKEIAKLIDSGKIKAPAISVKNIKDAAKAHDESAAGHTRGKLVLDVSF